MSDIHVLVTGASVTSDIFTCYLSGIDTACTMLYTATMRYKYQHTELWRENSAIIDSEMQELEAWLRRSKIDPDFDREEHVYVCENGDRWIFLPELSERQLMAATLILSSSELSLDDRPFRFHHPPAATLSDYEFDED
jgi:hypothetical protein